MAIAPNHSTILRALLAHRVIISCIVSCEKTTEVLLGKDIPLRNSGQNYYHSCLLPLNLIAI